MGSAGRNGPAFLSIGCELLISPLMAKNLLFILPAGPSIVPYLCSVRPNRLGMAIGRSMDT